VKNEKGENSEKKQKFIKVKGKHNAELQRADPAQKSRDNSVIGVVFSHIMPKMDFHYSHRFS